MYDPEDYVSSNSIDNPTIFVLIGIGIILLGIYLYFRTKRILEEGIKTQAKIVDYVVEEKEHERGPGKDYTYWPILEFTNDKGELIRQKHNRSYSSKIHSEEVAIAYIKNKIRYEIVFLNRKDNYTLQIVLIIFGIIWVSVILLLS